MIQDPIGGARSEAARVGLLTARAAAALRRGQAGAPLGDSDDRTFDEIRSLLVDISQALQFVSSNGTVGHSPSNLCAVELAIETAETQSQPSDRLADVLEQVVRDLDEFRSDPKSSASTPLLVFMNALSSVATREAGSVGETTVTL